MAKWAIRLLLPLAAFLGFATLAAADCRVVGAALGTAVWSCPSSCTNSGWGFAACSTVGSYWLPKGTFFDYTGIKVTCAGVVYAQFRAAQGVGKATYWLKAGDAAYCTDYCDSSRSCSINAAGLNLIKSFEGCCLVPYGDSRGVCTIGWGHSANAPTSPKPTYNTATITAATAETYLYNDLSAFAGYVRSYVKVPLTSNQFSALVSWTFNGGTTLLAGSRMLSKLNAWDYAGARFELADGFAQELQKRKQAEQALFSGTYTSRPTSTCTSSRAGVCFRYCFQSPPGRKLQETVQLSEEVTMHRNLLQSSTCRQISASSLNLRDSSCRVVRSVPAGTFIDFYGTRQLNRCQAGCDFVQIKYGGIQYWAAASCGSSIYIRNCPSTDCAACGKASHSEASAALASAGIPIYSSGYCSDRNRPTCTSLEQINRASVQGAIKLRQASGCSITVTGGTERGHEDGVYSHWNGYKLDFALNARCLDPFITSKYSYIGVRGDGSKQYKNPATGDIYAKEGDHWDVTFQVPSSCSKC